MKVDVKQLELTDDLVKLGIIDVYYNSEKIEIMFTRVDGKDDVIRLVVHKYGTDTINQLYSEVNGSMSNDALTYLMYHLSSKLLPIWDQIYKTPLANPRNNDTNDTNGISEELKEKDRRTKAEKILKIAEKRTQLFLDEYHTAYGSISVNAHAENIPLGSKRYRDWLRGEMYKEHNQIVDSQTLKDAIDVLSAKAEFGSGEAGAGQSKLKLNLRVAETFEEGKRIWHYDLTNDSWQFVRITSNGWEIDNNKILFKRFKNQEAQDMPSKDYPLDIFDRFMNLVNIKPEDRLLYQVYVVYVLVPNALKPILILEGEENSAKTFCEELTKAVLDPSVAKTFNFPTASNELIQQLSHNHVNYYDNVSLIPEWASNEVCRAVTGSGSSKRVLFSDDEDYIYSFKRAVGFNGINLAATKADLLDRSLLFKLEHLSEEMQRKPEDIWSEFYEIRPKLLGYIFDILMKLLKWTEGGGRLSLPRLPRMAEFCEYGEMISRLMGHKDNEFVNMYYKNIKLKTQEVIDASVLAPVIIEMMGPIPVGIRDTPTSLLARLNDVAYVLNINVKSKAWPKGANTLTRRLNELKTSLRKIGIHVDTGMHDGNKRLIKIERVTSSL